MSRRDGKVAQKGWQSGARGNAKWSRRGGRRVEQEGWHSEAGAQGMVGMTAVARGTASRRDFRLLLERWQSGAGVMAGWSTRDGRAQQECWHVGAGRMVGWSKRKKWHFGAGWMTVNRRRDFRMKQKGDDWVETEGW